MASEKAVITASGLTKTYGEINAIQNLAFEVRKGEVLGFLGPNGAGKTTTMKILTCFLAPTSGSATVAGHDVFESPLEVRKNVGYLPENAPLYTDMSVLEYLEFIAEVRGVGAAQRHAKIKRITDLCGLGDRLGSEIRTLSKGYRQRVGLAQAMVHEPPILILDEPTSGLDPNQIVEIRELIREIGRERTVILSTHNLPEVQASCNRVLIVNRGKIAATGTPEELQEGKGHNYFVTLDLGGADGAAKGAEAALGALEGASRAVETEREGTHVSFRLEAKGPDLRGRIFKLAVEKGWTMLELRTQAINLEDIFRQLTVDADRSTKKAA
ncbi:MAG: ATP-binding cassette domain-containing protein [Deltaproteobacteria bacterium]|nr:ATP-binding cassette domain-containing protein [Deltaproteobacteria bacterium]